MDENYYKDLGELVLGSRLRKISEKLLLEISGIYKSKGIDFEPGWFHILHLLLEKEELSITEIADILQVSHPSVIQVAKVLEKRELIHTFPGKEDRRKRMIRLTKEGRQLTDQVEPLWKKIKEAVAELLSKGKHSRFLLEALTELEENLDEHPLMQKVND